MFLRRQGRLDDNRIAACYGLRQQDRCGCVAESEALLFFFGERLGEAAAEQLAPEPNRLGLGIGPECSFRKCEARLALSDKRLELVEGP